MEPTLQNRREIFRLPLHDQRQVAPKVLDRLTDPDVTVGYVEQYLVRV